MDIIAIIIGVIFILALINNIAGHIENTMELKRKDYDTLIANLEKEEAERRQTLDREETERRQTLDREETERRQALYREETGRRQALYREETGRRQALDQKEAKLKKVLEDAIFQENVRKEHFAKVIRDVDTMIIEQCKCYPKLAIAMADILTVYYERSARFLETKPHPAFEEAKRIRELRKDTKKILKDKKELEYKLAYILELFPNITDIFDEGFDEGDSENMLEAENIDEVRYYISDEEYKNLSVSERNQLALDNYISRRKSKWQLGRDYEMYIGYLYEQMGYNVHYNGILRGLEDLGRDVIVTKDNDIVVIQCKRWAQEKTIHEKHIFQLYGTVVLFQIEHTQASGLFITTTSLSNKAREVAKYLGIETMEQFPLGDFPRIKCNINRTTGEKIYHLPFDQQYDKVIIEKSRGEMLVFTVKEAESKGFRRAYKHCCRE